MYSVCTCTKRHYTLPSAAEKQILTGEQEIFLKKTLSIDIIAKKGDLTEPRILVCPLPQDPLPPSFLPSSNGCGVACVCGGSVEWSDEVALSSKSSHSSCYDMNVLERIGALSSV